MALTKFVNNVQDISDDGGYKFRFLCDKCGNGFDSQYASSKSNILKTGLQVFNMLRPFGSGGQNVIDGIDRGLRGKEHDAAYEQAVHEAMVHFKKCTSCGKFVCPENCWNEQASMCEGCAPNAAESAVKRSAQAQAASATVNAVAGAFGVDLKDLASKIPGMGEAISKGMGAPAQQLHIPKTCPVCNASNQVGKFCQQCGGSLGPKHCPQCQAEISLTAKFCGSCGKPTT